VLGKAPARHSPLCQGDLDCDTTLATFVRQAESTRMAT